MSNKPRRRDVLKTASAILGAASLSAVPWTRASAANGSKLQLASVDQALRGAPSREAPFPVSLRSLQPTRVSFTKVRSGAATGQVDRK